VRTTRSLTGNFHFRLGAGLNVRHFFLTSSVYVDRFTLGTETLQIGANILGLTLAIGARI
jgi:hypothetical protein